jgi:gamma-glutamyltranspeptidase / glutathione hydrolase
VSAEDLAAYRVVEDEPLRGEFQGLSLAAQPRSNGSHLIELLQILDCCELSNYEHNSAPYIETVAKAMRAAAADYRHVQGRYEDEVLELEAEHVAIGRAEAWAQRIAQGELIDLPPSAQLTRGTTALTAVDELGNVVSFNHSIGYGGSGVVVSDLGFLLNGDMGHYNPRPGLPDSAEPGKRFSGGSPLLLLEDGVPLLAIGAPGGTRIVTSMVQSVLNALVFGMDMRTAVTAPRFHSQDGRQIFLEPSISSRTADELADRGWRVMRSQYQARPQAIYFRDGRAEGGSDPRGQTSADIGQYPPYDVLLDPARQE